MKKAGGRHSKEEEKDELRLEEGETGTNLGIGRGAETTQDARRVQDEAQPRTRQDMKEGEKRDSRISVMKRERIVHPDTHKSREEEYMDTQRR